MFGLPFPNSLVTILPLLHAEPDAAPTVAQLDAAVQWAEKQAASGRSVLVHCAHGHGRSATVLGAILLAEGHATSVDEAESLMQALRPRIRLNVRQRAGLQAWLDRRQHMQ